MVEWFDLMDNCKYGIRHQEDCSDDCQDTKTTPGELVRPWGTDRSDEVGVERRRYLRAI